MLFKGQIEASDPDHVQGAKQLAGATCPKDMVLEAVTVTQHTVSGPIFCVGASTAKPLVQHILVF